MLYQKVKVHGSAGRNQSGHLQCFNYIAIGEAFGPMKKQNNVTMSSQTFTGKWPIRYVQTHWGWANYVDLIWFHIYLIYYTYIHIIYYTYIPIIYFTYMYIICPYCCHVYFECMSKFRTNTGNSFCPYFEADPFWLIIIGTVHPLYWPYKRSCHPSQTALGSKPCTYPKERRDCVGFVALTFDRHLTGRIERLCSSSVTSTWATLGKSSWGQVANSSMGWLYALRISIYYFISYVHIVWAWWCVQL